VVGDHAERLEAEQLLVAVLRAAAGEQDDGGKGPAPGGIVRVLASFTSPFAKVTSSSRYGGGGSQASVARPRHGRARTYP